MYVYVIMEPWLQCLTLISPKRKRNHCPATVAIFPLRRQVQEHGLQATKLGSPRAGALSVLQHSASEFEPCLFSDRPMDRGLPCVCVKFQTIIPFNSSILVSDRRTDRHLCIPTSAFLSVNNRHLSKYVQAYTTPGSKENQRS
jgi:hypothetical protein